MSDSIKIPAEFIASEGDANKASPAALVNHTFTIVEAGGATKVVTTSAMGPLKVEEIE